jgi:hypothetical protein
LPPPLRLRLQRSLPKIPARRTSVHFTLCIMHTMSSGNESKSNRDSELLCCPSRESLKNRSDLPLLQTTLHSISRPGFLNRYKLLHLVLCCPLIHCQCPILFWLTKIILLSHARTSVSVVRPMDSTVQSNVSISDHAGANVFFGFIERKGKGLNRSNCSSIIRNHNLVSISFYLNLRKLTLLN